jgi:hypothetical protein
MIARAGVFYGRRGAARLKWYVDSVHGNDGNTGTGPGSALRTIAALQAKIQAGDHVGLARGSVWREQLEIGADGVTVTAYGSGAKPLLDCSDLTGAAEWSKTSGYTNVYQASVAVEGSGWMSVWEDDVRFLRTASLAELDTTAGRYFPSADPSGAGTVTLYVHASDSSNPAANAKRYEYSRRCYGLYTGHSHCTIEGLHTRRNLCNNGSLEVGRYCTLKDCLASEGTKHNLLVHGGCALVNVEAANSYYAGQSKVLMVWNQDSPQGEDVVFVNCYGHDEFEGDAAAFYGHPNVSGSFGRIVLRGCRADHVQVALPAVGDCAGVIIDSSDLWVVACTVNTTITDSTIRGNFRCLNLNSSPTVTMRNSTILSSCSVADSGADCVVMIGGDGATLDIQNSRITGTLKDGADYMLNGICFLGIGTLISRNNVFENLAHFYTFDGATYSVDSDYNQFNGPILAGSFRLPGWVWKTIPGWKEATGQDSHSTP